MTEQQQKQGRTSFSLGEFQQSIRDGKIVGYVCQDCGRQQIDILEFCPDCHNSHLKKTEFKGEGHVLTYTIQLVASEQFMNEVPYAWAIIMLDEGPKITGWIPFISKSSELAIGQKVRFKKSYLPGIVFEKA